MPASRSVRAVRAFVALGTVAVLTIGCAPETDRGDSQSVKTACRTLADAVDAAMTSFSETDAADAAAAAAATADVRARLTEAAGSIDNARVEAVVAELRAGFDVLADASAAAADGEVGSVTGLAEATDRIRSGVAEYHDLCGA
ncbi:hypothetical protein [Microbacterium oleivorans]|uniref:Biotin carboxylase n=1 Tax=Microbacterium oleivorans TaxID=273677 RepID=A0A031FMY9_9MICO|nr:hypothetical protein [Microbacterium oleivorans]EZP26174.1 Biotin carboxylase [Microbacterium oleivorans]THE08080.1 hypothetical protein E1I21_04360 [Microbacterium oleivorans]